MKKNTMIDLKVPSSVQWVHLSIVYRHIVYLCFKGVNLAIAILVPFLMSYLII